MDKTYHGAKISEDLLTDVLKGDKLDYNPTSDYEIIDSYFGVRIVETNANDIEKSIIRSYSNTKSDIIGLDGIEEIINKGIERNKKIKNARYWWMFVVSMLLMLTSIVFIFGRYM